MKMRGHSGEDISAVNFRSVAYRDIQKHPSNVYEVNHKLKYTAFIIDNKPPKLDIDLLDILYFGFYRYSLLYPNEYDPWRDIAPEYDIHADGSYTLSPVRNEHDNGGTRAYVIVSMLVSLSVA